MAERNIPAPGFAFYRELPEEARENLITLLEGKLEDRRKNIADLAVEIETLRDLIGFLKTL